MELVLLKNLEGITIHPITLFKAILIPLIIQIMQLLI